MSFDTLGWFMFYTCIMGFTILTLIQKNPIISILSLISVFFFSAIYLLQKLQLDYFAFVLLIIYIGAIAILFLFIVMMLNLKKVSQINVKKWFWFLLFINFLVFILLTLNDLTAETTDLNKYYFNYIDFTQIYDNVSQIQMFGLLCYTEYFIAFFFGGFILFVAVIGAIYITLQPTQELVKKQNISNQLSRQNKIEIK